MVVLGCVHGETGLLPCCKRDMTMMYLGRDCDGIGMWESGGVYGTAKYWPLYIWNVCGRTVMCRWLNWDMIKVELSCYSGENGRIEGCTCWQRNMCDRIGAFLELKPVRGGIGVPVLDLDYSRWHDIALWPWDDNDAFMIQSGCVSWWNRDAPIVQLGRVRDGIGRRDYTGAMKCPFLFCLKSVNGESSSNLGMFQSL